MFEYCTREHTPPDGLFFERLETFMDKCLADIRAFSERESRPFEETRQYIAEWHAKYLFQVRTPSEVDISAGPSSLTQEGTSKVLDILCETSRVLELLGTVANIQSFLLAVDPSNMTDQGFLGGSLSGREFWRGLRGGGESGAKSFKLQCVKDQLGNTAPSSDQVAANILPPGPKHVPSRSLKAELYESMRRSLRSVSGVRTAEMKWTSPERLDVYGVRMIGWPPDVPAQNPSSLKLSQNKHLMERLESGILRFEKILEGNITTVAGPSSQPEPKGQEVEEDFSWAYDAEGGGSGPDVPAIHEQSKYYEPEPDHTPQMLEYDVDSSMTGTVPPSLPSSNFPGTVSPDPGWGTPRSSRKRSHDGKVITPDPEGSDIS
ncbi:hypothetical protein BD779DRAFT_1495273 [Infundibulicybe gibba]|nr:hypothetical protein BD779DRAFT_1495273 [Infundibulicybe gibba]